MFIHFLMKWLKRTIFVFIIFSVCVMGIFYSSFLKKKQHELPTKKMFNVVLVGAAGSGKGTQGDLMKVKLNLLQVSAGEVLRQYSKNPKARYAKTVKKYTSKGKLVPAKITHKLIGEYIEKNALCKDCNYNGVIFDGFPRQMEQLIFLDKFLKKYKYKVDAVVSIDISMDALVDRLSGRFSCSKCGEIYHKTTKPTHVHGVCDKCGSTEFTVREDDMDIDAIKRRFNVYENDTKPVLDVYEKRGIVIHMDGTRTPQEISDDLIAKLIKIRDKEEDNK